MGDSNTKKGQSCNIGCPFCSKEGIIIAVIGLLAAFLLPPNLAYIGFLIFVSAYFLPTIKRIIAQRQ